MKFKLSENAKKAVMLGGMCAISYLAVYIVRNILGDEGFFPLFERDDEITQKAVEALTKP